MEKQYLEHIVVWRDKNGRAAVISDSDQFIAKMVAGPEGETTLSVGYSSPNYAEVIGDREITAIRDALDALWEKTEKKPLEEMLAALLRMAQEANRAHKEWIADTITSNSLVDLTRRDTGTILFVNGEHFEGNWSHVQGSPFIENGNLCGGSRMQYFAAKPIPPTEGTLNTWELYSDGDYICTVSVR